MIQKIRHEFSARASVWSEYGRQYKYISRENFSAKVLSRNRFEILRAYIRFSYQPNVRKDIRSGTYRWMLVDDFVAAFNQHRRANFSPSWLLCIDESISKWDGLGRSYISKGIPVFTAIGRKPEYGGEIQNSACGVVDIMTFLHVVKSADQEDHDAALLGGSSKSEAK